MSHILLHSCAGPAVSIDTACSSSLSATSLAMAMLQQGKCSRGIITAALLTLDPDTLTMLTAASMLSPDGRCKTLDAAADGSALLSVLLSCRSLFAMSTLLNVCHVSSPKNFEIANIGFTALG